jgi:hypothetical protein
VDAIRQAASLEAGDRPSATNQLSSQEQAAAPEHVSAQARPVSPKAGGASVDSGFPLVDAYASLGSRSVIRSDVVYGPDNQVAQIRVVDALTREVICSSPPDTIAHMQMEIEAYQEAARNKLGST